MTGEAGQTADAHHQSDEADRHVDQEHPPPAGGDEQAATTGPRAAATPPVAVPVEDPRQLAEVGGPEVPGDAGQGHVDDEEIQAGQYDPGADDDQHLAR